MKIKKSVFALIAVATAAILAPTAVLAAEGASAALDFSGVTGILCSRRGLRRDGYRLRTDGAVSGGQGGDHDHEP